MVKAKWIEQIECDFCFDSKDKKIYYVELPLDIQTYAACMDCIKEKEWV